jgi:hypothetical protein
VDEDKNMRRDFTVRVVRRMVRFVIFVIIFVAVFGTAVLLLWNGLMPGLFGLPHVTFSQAVGLMALSWLLFGGWRGFGRPAGGSRWRRRMLERWEQMTPDERERFRQGFRTVDF